jgi:hypothetical protein
VRRILVEHDPLKLLLWQRPVLLLLELSAFRRDPIYSQDAKSENEKGLDKMARIPYNNFDYVIRRFNAPSAGLNLR